MELPVQIMIVLFVTIIVGASVIMFSSNIINNAKAKMADPLNKEVDEDKILDVISVTDNSLNTLVEECYEKNKQDAVSKTLCFVLHGESSTADPVNIVAPGITIEANFNVGDKSLFIYYNPDGDKIQVQN